MSDQQVYKLDEGQSLHIRTTRYGEPDCEVRLLYRNGGSETEVISPPLGVTQLSILAHAFARAYFNATGRVAWPTSGSMLVCYEKEQAIAEREHLDWLRDSPAPGAAELHLRFEEQAMRRRLKDLGPLRIEPDDEPTVEEMAAANAEAAVAPRRRVL